MAKKRRSLDVHLVAAHWLRRATFQPMEGLTWRISVVHWMFSLWLLIGWRSGRLRRRTTPDSFGANPPGECYVGNVRSENNTACHGGYCQLLLGVGVVTTTCTAVLPRQGLLIGARVGTEMINVDEENLSRITNSKPCGGLCMDGAGMGSSGEVIVS